MTRTFFNAYCATRDTCKVAHNRYRHFIEIQISDQYLYGYRLLAHTKSQGLICEEFDNSVVEWTERLTRRLVENGLCEPPIGDTQHVERTDR